MEPRHTKPNRPGARTPQTAMSLAVFLGLFGGQGLATGETAPLLKARDSYGKPVDFAELLEQGRYMVLWFYPKAKLPGCAVQGQRYSGLFDEFMKLKVEVFGVSRDPAREQCDFVQKLALRGRMLPDTKGAIAKAFKAGGIFGFYSRDTFLINPKGKIEMVWRGVNPFKDPDIVLAYLKQKQY